MAKITFEGAQYEYDPKQLTKFSVIKAISGAVSNPAEFFGAFDKIFKGKTDKYVEMLDDDMVKVQALLNAIIEQEGEAKN